MSASDFIANQGSEQALMEHHYAYKFSIVDLREASPQVDAGSMTSQSWMRYGERLPDTPMIHAAVLAYMSDLDFLDVALTPHIELSPAFSEQGVMCFSLDHAIWFHRPFRADEWLLFDKESIRATGARGLVRGRFFTRDGTLVASVAQECLIRSIEPQHQQET